MVLRQALYGGATIVIPCEDHYQIHFPFSHLVYIGLLSTTFIAAVLRRQHGTRGLFASLRGTPIWMSPWWDLVNGWVPFPFHSSGYWYYLCYKFNIAPVTEDTSVNMETLDQWMSKVTEMTPCPCASCQAGETALEREIILHYCESAFASLDGQAGPLVEHHWTLGEFSIRKWPYLFLFFLAAFPHLLVTPRLVAVPWFCIDVYCTLARIPLCCYYPSFCSSPPIIISFFFFFVRN